MIKRWSERPSTRAISTIPLISLGKSRVPSMFKPLTRPVTGAMMAAMVVSFPVAVGDTAGDQAEHAKLTEAVVANELNIETLIINLADESFDVREQATQGLWMKGERCLPALRKAVLGNDPEVVDRAAELILYISAGVIYDSSDEVKDLVLKFSQGDAASKLSILKKLTDLGQWKQVLHLARFEKDAEMRAKMGKIVQATVLRVSRDALVEGDLELVSEILELSGDSDQALIVKAWFYVQQGKLKQQLAAADTMPEKQGTLWRMALYRVSGNLEAAMLEAKKAGRTKLVASLQVLAGDANSWLGQNMDIAVQDVIFSRSCQIQRARLANDLHQAKILVRELKRLAVNEDTAARVIAGLAANGYHAEAILLLERYDVDSAFEYHDSIESPERALALLDIPEDAKPPFTDWVKSFTDYVIEDEEEDLYDRLLMVAGFLVRHGEGEHSEAVIKPMMDAFSKDGSDVWFELIGKMPKYELGPQAMKLIDERGNDDGEADLAVRMVLDSSKGVDHLWTAVKNRNNQDVSKALREIFLLAGLIPDPNNETRPLHQALLDEVVDKLQKVQTERKEALFTFAVRRHEVGVASAMVDSFIGENGDRWQRTKLFLDATLNRWKKLEPAYAAREKQVPGDYYNLVKWSICLRKLDRKKKSDEVLNRALLLTMGDNSAMCKIATELSNAGYAKDAILLCEKAAMMADPAAPSYDRAIVYLATISQPHVSNTGAKAKDKEKVIQSWKVRSAIAEVYSRFTMSGRSNGSILGVLNARFKADFYRGMDHLENGKRSQALKLFTRCQMMNPGTGGLADDFFPALRGAGVDKEYRQWFESSYRHVEAACQRFPKAHNTHNTAAWLAARALLRLDDAMRHAETAITLRPGQGAYLDTMAEVWFAKENRKKAIEWSKKAIDASIGHAQGTTREESQVLGNYRELRKQLQRFEGAPMPRLTR